MTSQSAPRAAATDSAAGPSVALVSSVRTARPGARPSCAAISAATVPPIASSAGLREMLVNGETATCTPAAGRAGTGSPAAAAGRAAGAGAAAIRGAGTAAIRGAGAAGMLPASSERSAAISRLVKASRPVTVPSTLTDPIKSPVATSTTRPVTRNCSPTR